VLVIGENDELELWRNKIVERKLRWDGGDSERAKCFVILIILYYY